MNGAMIHTWRADLFDRARRRNYLVILLCMSIVTALFFPSSSDQYATVLIGGYRGIYNAQWVGASLSILSVTFLPIICFYLVKNAIEGDRQRGVCELIAATPVSKLSYVTGKWLANLSLLFGVMFTMSIAAVFVQLWHGESYSINLPEVLLPQLLFVLPILAVISAAAVLFETIPVLRGGIGNVAYFFLWVSLTMYAVEGGSGISVIIDQMQTEILALDPSSKGNVNIGVYTKEDLAIKTFVWQGMAYIPHAAKPISIMLGFSGLLLAIAIMVFDRFKNVKQNATQQQAGGKIAKALAAVAVPMGKTFEIVSQPWAFTRLVRQECLLLIRGASVWWYVIMAGLAVAQLTAPVENVRLGVIPATWLLCVLMFSPMGHRELHQGAQQLVFSCLSPIRKQFPAMLLAGFLVALFVVFPAFIRFVLTGEWFSALMLLTGALFIPSLAIACGALTRTSRTFEILFTVIWYMGPLQRSPLDFVGVDPAVSQQQGAPLMFFIASLVLIGLALLGRKGQLM